MPINPKISVIIPTYNRADLIKDSIKSVLDQTYDDFELIISDDGSTDNTEEVVKSINDDRIIYHSYGINKGAGGARNEGVRIARGEYIAFHDSDDICLPDRLERQMTYMTEHPDAGMVYGIIHIFDGDEERFLPKPEDKGKIGAELYPYLLVRNIIDTPSMFVRKQCFESLGGFREDLRALEDWDFALRFAKKYEIGYFNEVVVDSYVTENSVSSSIPAYYETRAMMIAEYKDDMMKYGIFDHCVMDLFEKAERRGLLSPVQQYLMKCLSL